MNTSAVNLNDIPLFVEVARRKSFSLAGLALKIPVSTLSRRVSDLERAIGVPLLNRNTRRIGLTEAGIAYFKRCEKLVDAATVAHEALSPASPAPAGVLRVAISHSLAVLLLPHTIGDFLHAHPGIVCEFDLTMRRPDAASGFFDVMLRLASSGDPSGMFVRELASVPTYLYASRTYLARHGEPDTPDALSAHQCVRTSASDSDSYWDLYGPQGSRERVAVHGRVSVNNVSAASSLSGLHLGITRLPLFPGAQQTAERMGLKRVLPDWQLAPLPLYAVFPSSTLPARTRAFMTYVEAELAKKYPHA